MGITIKEIAEKAQVSIGTVDRVLHNRGRFSEETASKIRAICKEYGYTSNVAGKAMALQRSRNIVAVVINAKERNTFSFLVHQGIEDYSKTVSEYNVIFEYHDVYDNTPEEMSSILDSLMEMDIRGLVIKPIDDFRVKERLVKISEEKRIPVVTCTSELQGFSSLSYVGQDHRKLGRMLACTASKVSKKTMRILVVVGPLNNYARGEKLAGFCSYLDEKDVDYSIQKVLEVPYDEGKAYNMVKEALKTIPEINSIYLHPPVVDPCLDAIKEDCGFNGLVFAYSTPSSGHFIKDGSIDFAVYEDPYQQGYLAGNVMFSYLLNGRKPLEKNLLKGQIVFDENC